MSSQSPLRLKEKSAERLGLKTFDDRNGSAGPESYQAIKDATERAKMTNYNHLMNPSNSVSAADLPQSRSRSPTVYNPLQSSKSPY